MLALRLEREIDLHDRVLLDDPDQHHQPDERVDIELVAEQVQGDERAEARGRQPGENRDRVDVALVQHPQHDVDDADRDEQQQAEVGHRLLEGLRRSLEGRRHRRRQQAGRDAVDVVDGGAKRHARAKAERDRHCRQLADVVHRLGPDRLLRRQHRLERHQRAGRRLERDRPERIGVLLILRIELEQHLVLRLRAVDG